MVLTPQPLAPPARPDTLPGLPHVNRGDTVTIQTLRRENARYRIAQEFNRRVPQERDVTGQYVNSILAKRESSLTP
jgi:hypothetical protein